MLEYRKKLDRPTVAATQEDRPRSKEDAAAQFNVGVPGHRFEVRELIG